MGCQSPALQKMIRFFLTITSDMVGMTQHIPVQFSLATDIDPVIIVFNTVCPHRIDVRGFIWIRIFLSVGYQFFPGFNVSAPSKVFREPSTTAIKLQYTWTWEMTATKFQHPSEGMVPCMSSVKFGHMITHKKRAVLPLPYSLQFKPKLARYTCQNADGTRQSFSAW